MSFITNNRSPDFTETAGQSALWEYKAIYLDGDDRADHGSDVVSIPVAD